MSKLTISKLKPHFTVGFYTEYKKQVLEKLKYNNTLVEIFGVYDISEIPFLKFEDYSFDRNNVNFTNGKSFYLSGLIYHCSTVEDFNIFTNCIDKGDNGSYQKKSDEFISELVNITNDMNPSFIVVTYLDLKHFEFRYVFKFFDDVKYKIEKLSIIRGNNNKENIPLVLQNIKLNDFEKINDHLINGYAYLMSNEKDEASILAFDNKTSPHDLSNIFKLALNGKSSSKNQSSMEIILIKNLSFLEGNFNNSIIMNISNIEKYSISEIINQKKMIELMQKEEYHVINLKSIFDEASIAKDSVDLNINLMKWRMAPQLNTKKIHDSSFLLFGAGTLGCHVARGLMGWGVRNISFVDNGKVSFSNPVRQSLYSFSDSVEGAFKAEKACEKLKEIFPLINSKGYNLSIPLPGRKLINDEASKSYMNSVNKIEGLVKQHDYILLLTDSRESRWLPTILSSLHNKPCISSAIGFDSFCVIKHGLSNDINKSACYFCSDVHSPNDTTKNRTLDQQCTISRPGISNLCSGFTVEMIINECSGSFDKTPHCLRGNIMNWEISNIDSPSFSQ